jgi:molybdenum cofactor guanylyltransferase
VEDTEALAVGAILAGGRSRRFGSPKGLARLEGDPLIEHVYRALTACVAETVIVTAAAEWYDFLRLPTTPDLYPESGPLAGLHAALKWALGRAAGVVCAPCDAPFLHPGLVAAILERADPSAIDAVLPESDSPLGFEPLFGWYSTALVPAIEERLRRGDLALRGLAAGARVRYLPLRHVRGFGDPSVLFLNVNTRADLARARELAGER